VRAQEEGQARTWGREKMKFAAARDLSFEYKRLLKTTGCAPRDFDIGGKE
jgi:hypothetical protein